MDMDNVSKMLKEARLAKGLSLEEAEAATSIRKLYLDAVEEGEFDKIPGDVFTKGIIRTYGNFLGLNGPDLVNIYKAQNSGLTKEAVAPKPIRMVEKISISPQIKPERVSSGNWLSYIVVLALVIVVAGGIAWFMNTDSSQNLISEPAAVENSMPAEEKAAPKPVYDGVNLALKCVNDRCWMEVTADGEIVFSGIMEAGQQQSFKAKENISVHYGNIGAMEITVNGEILPKDPEVGSVVRTYKK